VALVFGPERGGLTAEEVALCDARLSLPTDPRFPTLNLAQAVAATLALARSAGTPAQGTGGLAAPSRDVARLLDTLHGLLEANGFPGKGRSRAVLAEIDSFLRRGRPTEREVTLLLGALAALGRPRADQTSRASASRARSVMNR
jgi:tRNA C32,U32 (ribose-2'-O)-methylase TrmJ